MTRTLASYIDQIVSENSGGVKFIELMVSLMDLTAKEDRTMMLNLTADSVEDEIKTNMSHLGILEYAMNMDESTQRIKSFVYRKIL